MPHSVFYPYIRNAGATSHFNTLSSILTGTWQRLDDWGKTSPTSPTLFEYLRKRMGLPQDDAWFISSNKALTSRIGASSMRDFGPRYGANVVFPKQLLINAVIKAAAEGHPDHSADKASFQPELEAILRQADNYEGLGGQSPEMNPPLTCAWNAPCTRPSRIWCAPMCPSAGTNSPCWSARK